jgi:hypothetical protein
MSDRWLPVILYVSVFVFILSVLSAGLIKRFAEQLTLKEGFFIALLAYAVSTTLLIVYFIAKPTLQIPSYVDGLSTIVWMSVTGIVSAGLRAIIGAPPPAANTTSTAKPAGG